MKNYLRVAGILLLPMLLSACNTVEGFAKDLQLGGTKIEKTIKGKETEKNEVNKEKPRTQVKKRKKLK